MRIANTLIVIKVEKAKASQNGDTAVRRVLMFDIENRSECFTYVCNKYGNSKRWRKVIDNYEAGYASILKGHMKYKDIMCIDADSAFEFFPQVNYNDAYEIVDANR